METPEILVVEDEAITAMDLQAQLTSLGFSVAGVVHSGEAAVEWMQGPSRPGIVVMDIALGGQLDGVEAARIIRQYREIPIIFLTAHSDTPTLQRAKKVAPYGYVVKPFQQRDLQTAIEVALHRYRSEAEGRLYREAVESATVGIAIARDEADGWPIVQCNQAFSDIYGYPSAELLGRAPHFACTGRRQQLEAEIAAAIEAGTNFNQTFKAERADGSVFWNELSIQSVSHEDARPDHLLVFSSDVTARQESRRELIQSQKLEALGKLTGQLAHDFNNLLGIVVGNLDILRMEAGDNPAIRAYVDRGIDAAERGIALTRRLLSVAKQEELQERRVDLRGVLRDLRPLMLASVGQAIRLRMQLPDEPVFASLSVNRFETALLNLVVNARDAIEERGEVQVRLSMDDDDSEAGASGWGERTAQRVRLDVVDDGCGMGPEVLERAFEPFYTNRPSRPGTGLGLAMVKEFTEEAGGSVTLESARGTGTRVRLELPASPPPRSQPTPVAALDALSEQAAGWVVVVDDEPGMLKVASKVLESAGFRVSEAASAEEALALIRKHWKLIDLLLTDIVMPDVNGFELADQVSEIDRGIKALFMSGRVEVLEQALQVPADRLIRKPFRSDELVRAVRLTLEENARPGG